jgi:hypothetical protein
MQGWLTSLLVSLAVGLILLLLSKLTTKSSADFAGDIKELQGQVKDLQKDLPTTEGEVQLERRLTLIEAGVKQLQIEVDFTITSHQEFLRLLERAFIPVAHSPHTPELDRLLDKRENGEELSTEEWEELIRRLDEEARLYDNLPGKKVALRGLRAIYLTQLRVAQKRQEKTREGLLGTET